MDRNHPKAGKGQASRVALRKESVDRNPPTWTLTTHKIVALRKESVDRNKTFSSFLVGSINVALRKESVDRNTNFSLVSLFDLRRSPQGERG